MREELAKLSWPHAAAALIAAAWAVWASGPSWLAPAYVVAAAVGVALFAIDVAERRLPNVLTLPLAGTTAVLLLMPGHLDAWARALLGGLALGAAYLLLHLVNPSGLGLGDAKLALTLGLLAGWHGWIEVFAIGAAAFVTALPTSLFLIVSRRGKHIAFGPYMLVGALLVLTAVRVLRAS